MFLRHRSESFVPQAWVLTQIRLFILLLFPLATGWGQQLPENLADEVDAIFSAYGPQTPGVAVGLLHKDQLVFSKAYGRANLEKQVAARTDSTVFALASVSKQFTVFAIMLLAEAGQLSLEDPVRKYLPEFPDYGATITLRHLATNTSGVRSDLHLLGMRGLSPSDAITQEMVMDIILRQRALNFLPGERFRYSNAGFVLLAEIVARVSGQPFADYMKEKVFAPLGMNETFVMEDATAPVDHLASSYQPINNRYVRQPMQYSFYGSSGIFTTLVDFAKWAANFATIKVGSSSIFATMNTPAVFNNGQSSFYALGQFVDTHRGLHQVQHGGGTAAYRAYLGRFPEQDISVVLLSNDGTINVGGKALEVADLLLAPFIEAAANSEENVPEEITDYRAEPKALIAVAGRYLEQSNYYLREIVQRGDTLFYVRPEQGNRASQLLPWAKDTFLLAGADSALKVVFTKGLTGWSMHLAENGVRVESFAKIEEPKPLDWQSVVGKYYSPELDTYYQLSEKKGQLSAYHSGIGSVALAPISKNGFFSSTWQFSYLELIRDERGQVTGFHISSDRAQRVRFRKE